MVPSRFKVNVFHKLILGCYWSEFYVFIRTLVATDSAEIKSNCFGYLLFQSNASFLVSSFRADRYTDSAGLAIWGARGTSGLPSPLATPWGDDWTLTSRTERFRRLGCQLKAKVALPRGSNNARHFTGWRESKPLICGLAIWCRFLKK